jgi:hypothetical protein
MVNLRMTHATCWICCGIETLHVAITSQRLSFLESEEIVARVIFVDSQQLV